MARPKKTAAYRAKESFVTQYNGEPIVVAAGDLVHPDAGILKGRDELFQAITEDQMFRFGADEVESATAAPGEKR